MRRQPWLCVLIVERPRWNNGQESKGGASEADVQSQFDVLSHETYKEGKDLGR